MHYLWYHYFKLDVICFKILSEIQYVVVLNSIEISAIGKPRRQISKYPIFYTIEYFITVNYWHRASIFNDTLSTAQTIVKKQHTITQFILYEKLSNPFDVLTKYVILNNALISTVLLRDEMLVT